MQLAGDLRRLGHTGTHTHTHTHIHTHALESARSLLLATLPLAGTACLPPRPCSHHHHLSPPPPPLHSAPTLLQPSITHWVTGYGTGGTFHGAGKAIKEKKPDVKIILAEPEDAGLLVSGIPTERNADGSPVASHPAFKPHPIQGWTPDFIPKVLEDAPMANLMEELVPIPGASAVATAKLLAAKEGLLTGISGGGTMWAALETAKKVSAVGLRSRLPSCLAATSDPTTCM